MRSCGGIKFASSLVEVNLFCSFSSLPSLSLTLLTIMIAPITGKFRKLFLKDLTIALTLGGIAGAGWWNLYHLPQVQRRDAFYAKLEASKSQ